MNKEELIQFLKDNLVLEISENEDMYSHNVIARIKLCDEIITEDSYQIKNKL